MRYCRKCGVSLRGKPMQCPFCRNELVGEPEGENVFPDIPYMKKPYWLMIRLFALGSVIAACLCAVVNLSLPQTGYWSLFVAAGLTSAWISAGSTLKKRGNLLKAIFWQICVVSVLVLAWDFGTGFLGWSINFVLPILYTCSILAVFTLAWCMHMPPQEYLFYLILNILLGFVPLILYLCGVLWIVYPSLVCVFVSVVTLAALLLFLGRQLRGELGRRFHV